MLDVPLGVVTVTCTEPAPWAGASTVIDESEFTTTLVVATLPKVTVLAPDRLLPRMVMTAPPFV